jgi:hypothetical protein
MLEYLRYSLTIVLMFKLIRKFKKPLSAVFVAIFAFTLIASALSINLPKAASAIDLNKLALCPL